MILESKSVESKNLNVIMDVVNEITEYSTFDVKMLENTTERNIEGNNPFSIFLYFYKINCVKQDKNINSPTMRCLYHKLIYLILQIAAFIIFLPIIMQDFELINHSFQGVDENKIGSLVSIIVSSKVKLVLMLMII